MKSWMEESQGILRLGLFGESGDERKNYDSDIVKDMCTEQIKPTEKNLRVHGDDIDHRSDANTIGINIEEHNGSKTLIGA